LQHVYYDGSRSAYFSASAELSVVVNVVYSPSAKKEMEIQILSRLLFLAEWQRIAYEGVPETICLLLLRQQITRIEASSDRRQKWKQISVGVERGRNGR
jgi:hypothetical protein